MLLAYVTPHISFTQMKLRDAGAKWLQEFWVVVGKRGDKNMLRELENEEKIVFLSKYIVT